MLYMVKRVFKKRIVQKRPLVRKGGRRAQVKAVAGAVFPSAAKVVQAGYSIYRDNKKRQAKKYNRTKDQLLASSDNITTLATCKIGTPRVPDFAEKVARLSNPPIIMKRNYQFNVEGVSGRKTWFSFEGNQNNNNDLKYDVENFKRQFSIDTATVDPGLSVASPGDNAKYYIDYLSDKIRMVNSSSNSIMGKIHLFIHKRDNDNAYSSGNVPITPINLMMYFSSQRLPLQFTNNEASVGQGFNFDASTVGSNYSVVYNMPGSSINTQQNCARTDPTLSPSSGHISDSMNFFFSKHETTPFSLKPGQEICKAYVFADLPEFHREQDEYHHIAGVSYSIVVEFIGGIVGDSTTTTGDGRVSTGTSQIACIRETRRIIGIKQKIRPKVALITPALFTIADGNQYLINPDTGASKIGVDQDI